MALGQGVSTFGSALFLVSMVTYLAPRGPGAVAGFQVAAVVPILFLSPLAGVWVSMLAKKRVLVGADIWRGVVLLVLAAVWTGESASPLLPILVAAASLSLGTAVFQPAVQAIIPEIHPNPRRATALRLSVNLGANLAGSLAGAALAGLLPLRTVIVINALSFLATAFQESWIRPISAPRAGGLTLRATFGPAFADVMSQRRSVAALGLMGLIYGPLVTALPFLIARATGGGFDSFGYVYPALLAGGAAGSVAAAQGRWGWSHRARPASLALAVSFILAAMFSRLPVLVPALILGGAAAAILQLAWVNRVLEGGRWPAVQFGIVESLLQVAAPVGQWAAAVALASANDDPAYLLVGLAAVSVMVGLLERRQSKDSPAATGTVP